MNTGFDSWFKQHFFEKLAESNRFVTTYLALDLFLQTSGCTIVETGTIREENHWPDGMSSLVFGNFCKKYRAHLHTIDVSESHLETCRKATTSCRDHISYHHYDSVSFLKNFNGKIDLLYLDSMDCPANDSLHSPQLLASQHHQLNELKVAFDKLSEHPIVLLDDNNFQNGGKTRLSKLFLGQNGFREVMSWQQSLWVKLL